MSHGSAIALTIDNLAKEFDMSHELVESGIQALISAAVDLETMNETQQIHELQESLRKSIQLMHRQAIEKQTLLSLKRLIEKQELAIENLQKVFSEKTENIEPLSDDRVHGHPSFREFRQKVWEVKHPGEALPDMGETIDEDVVVATEKDAHKCPITTKALTSPIYSSKKCRHHFSSAILDFLSYDRACPVTGCRALLSKRDIERDAALERNIARSQLKEMSQTADQEGYEDVGDE